MVKILTPEEFTLKVKAALDGDGTRPIIRAHEEIDHLMCDLLEALGYGEGVELFVEEDKFYA